jgi:predicted ATPase/class 3 adenylate cyclase
VTDLPMGTVAFLFTDIEGSTRLWQEQPEAMGPALARHDALVREMVEAHAGHVVKTTGDGAHAVFTTAADALDAAIDAQVALATEQWPLIAPLRVRMGVHVGPAELRDGDYFGPAVNRAARLMAVAHGGQIVTSLTTEELVAEQVPDDVTFLDLGEHQLPDVVRPERVFQVVHPRLELAFPPLRSRRSERGNLGVPTSTFVGRDREVAAIGELLREGQLVSLVGVGGVGKTRLALEVATRGADEYRDGAWFVALAGVGDEELFDEGVADALGVVQRPGISLRESLLDHLRDKRMLVVLDNCEHLVAPVSSFVEEALRAAVDLRVLATSREGLDVAGERVVPVSVMAAPAADAAVEELLAADSVRLFVVRASEAGGASTPLDDELRDIALLCRRLDGIPLGIELAAARRRSMTPAEILSHLDQRFRVLTGGRRTAVGRHQTMRNAVDWSYDLLGPREQSLLHRLAIFAGSFDLAAAEAVAAGPELDRFDVVDVLGQLVDKSLVVTETRETRTRFRLFDTIRDYAWERLELRGEVDEYSRRHAEHYVVFATEAKTGITGPDEAVWVPLVRDESDNLRAALRWAILAGESNLALRLVAGLTVSASPAGNPFGVLAEQAAAMPGAEGHLLRPVALSSAAFSARYGDPHRAVALAMEAVDAADAPPGDLERLEVRCLALGAFGSLELSLGGDVDERSVALVDEMLVCAREVGEPHLLSTALELGIGVHAEMALAYTEEALVFAEATSNPSQLSFALTLLARVVSQADPPRARAYLEVAIAHASSVRNEMATDYALQILAFVELAERDFRASLSTLVDTAERALWAGNPTMRNIVFHQLSRTLAMLGVDEVAFLVDSWLRQREIEISDDGYSAVGAGELADAYERAVSAASDTQLRAAAARADTMSDRELLEVARSVLTNAP